MPDTVSIAHAGPSWVNTLRGCIGIRKLSNCCNRMRPDSTLFLEKNCITGLTSWQGSLEAASLIPVRWTSSLSSPQNSLPVSCPSFGPLEGRRDRRHELAGCRPTRVTQTCWMNEPLSDCQSRGMAIGVVGDAGVRANAQESAPQRDPLTESCAVQ